MKMLIVCCIFVCTFQVLSQASDATHSLITFTL